MNYFMMHTFFIIMVVFGIVAVTAFLVCVVRVIIFDIKCRRWWRSFNMYGRVFSDNQPHQIEDVAAVGGGVSVGYDD